MFSVIVITQDSATGLKRTLRSIRSQLYAATDVVVVDRGVNGDAEVLANDFRRRCEVPLQYLHRPGLGRGAAFNLGIASASGSHFTFLVAQDELLPFALEQYGKHFQRHPDSDVCYGRCILRDRAGKLAPSFDKRLPEGDLLETVFRSHLAIQSSAVACSRRPIDAGRHFPTNGQGLEPIEFLIRLAAEFPFHCVQEDVVIVENRVGELLPETASLLSSLWERLSTEFGGRLSPAARVEGIAKVEYSAALAWWRAGNAWQAQRHIERALSLTPMAMRYWWLASLIRSRKLFGSLPRPLGDAA